MPTDQKSTSWTRVEDYWPARRTARGRRSAANHRRSLAQRGETASQPRLTLSVIPYGLLMLCMAVLAIAIMATAWPGNRAQAEAELPRAAEVGNAPKGWLEPPR